MSQDHWPDLKLTYDPTEEFGLTILPNGTRIVTRRTPNVRFVDFTVRINAGCFDARRDGVFVDIPHIIEHLVFKKNHELPAWTAFARAQGLCFRDETRARYDADSAKTGTTGMFDTKYRVQQLFPDSFDAALTYFCRKISAPDLSDEAVRGEVTVMRSENIVHERARAYNLTMKAQGSLLGSAFSRRLPHDHLGGEKLTGRDLQDFHQRHYLSGEAIVAVEGPVEHDHVVSLVKKHLRLKTGQRKPRIYPTISHKVDLRKRLKGAGVEIGLLFWAPSPMSLAKACAHELFWRYHYGSLDKNCLHAGLRGEGKLYSVLSEPIGDGPIGMSKLAFSADTADVPARLGDVARILHATDPVDGAFFELQRRSLIDRASYAPGYTSESPPLADMLFLHGRMLPQKEIVGTILSLGPKDLKAVAEEIMSKPISFIAQGDTDGLPAPAEIQNILRSPKPMQKVLGG